MWGRVGRGRPRAGGAAPGGAGGGGGGRAAPRARGARAAGRSPARARASRVLSAMVGHLFGYECALAIDAQARPLREIRAAIEAVVSAHAPDVLDSLAHQLAGPATRFVDGLRSGSYDGHLEASTAIQLTGIL